MVTLIYNISRPEQGGVGRYAYELLTRLRNKIKFNEIDLSPSFGKTNFEKLLAVLGKRKQYLLKQGNKFSELNHFLQVEIFYPILGKNIVTLHNPPPFTSYDKMSYFRDYYSLVRSALFLKRYREVLHHADYIIANSQLTKKSIVDTAFEENKIKTISLGVNENFKIITPFEERRDIIGYVGSFAVHKRIDKLLNEWKMEFNKLQEYSLNLFGSGGVQFKGLKNKYENKNNVKFLGLLTQRNIVKKYNSFKAFVFPSKWEPFGFPIIEAVACGTPVFIYTDAEITPEVRKYAIEIENVSNIPKILDNINQSELKKLSRKVKKEFDWKKTADKTIEVYKKFGY
jgi:glycosyltransferase involved in cell wall biosynthesis